MLNGSSPSSSTCRPHRPGGQRWSRGFTRQQFEQWRTGTRTLSTLAATTSSIGFVRTSQGTARLWGGMVSGSTFPLLGSRALLGRTLVETDDSAPNVVVLSFDVWRRLFRSDPDIIGKPAEFLDIDGRARVLTIVGIMPADFEFPDERMAFFVPFDPSDTSREGGRALRAARTPAARRQRRGGAGGRRGHRAGDRRAIACRRAADGRPGTIRGAERQGARGAGTASGAPCVLRGRGRPAAHRLRQRRQSVAGARRRPSPRDGRAGGDGREPLANRA